MNRSADPDGRSMSRAERRHHRRRMIARAIHARCFADMTDSERIHISLRVHDHLKACSCSMCGNSRKYEGERTVQERRAHAARPGGWD